MLRHSIALSIIVSAIATAAVLAPPPVVRSADPIKRGLRESDFPRTIKVTDSVYTYEDFHAGAEKLTIPGHGFTEQGPVSREKLRAYHRALETVIAEATRLHRVGVPVDDAITQATWSQYASWTVASSQPPIAVRRV